MMCKQILNGTLIGTVRVELVLNKRCIEVWPGRYAAIFTDDVSGKILAFPMLKNFESSLNSAKL